MKELKIFNTYNQITKLFDVTVMTKQQINKLDNNHGFLVLAPKKQVDVVKPSKKPRKAQAPKWFRDFVVQKFDPLVQRVSNLEEAVSTQFKTHGWTK